MTNRLRLTAVAVLTSLIVTGILLVVLGVNGDFDSHKGMPAAVVADNDSELLEPTSAATVVQEFVAAATSDDVAAAFPDNATADTFWPAVSLVDPSAPSAKVVSMLSDFAMLKLMEPSSEITVDIDVEMIVVKDGAATVPQDAVTVLVDGVAVPNSEQLALGFGHLKIRNGAWTIAFPQPTPSAVPPK